MQDDQDWEECIEVDVKGEAPLYILIPGPWLEEEGVGDVPQARGDHQTHPHHVHEDHIQQELKKSPEMNAQDQRETSLNKTNVQISQPVNFPNRGYDEPSRKEN